MEDNIMLAKDIEDCENCPLWEKDCHGYTSDGQGNPVEPPCCSWNDEDEIYERMYDGRGEELADYYERMESNNRKAIAKRAAATRKKYSHLNEKYAKFKEWLPESNWRLIITSRRKDLVYMRALGKRRANFAFNLETEKFGIIRGNLGLGDYTTVNRFENDFKEFYYGKRPEDRDFVKECFDTVNKFFEM